MEKENNMNLENEFIPYEQALALKELGFDEPCLGWYLPEIVDKGNVASVILGSYITKWNKFGDRLSVPTFSQAFRWFREKYNLDKIIDNWTEQPMNGEIWDKAYQYYINGEAYHPYFKTHEEAELACLKKLIEIVKQK
jgi:hypothetical protein